MVGAGRTSEGAGRLRTARVWRTQSKVTECLAQRFGMTMAIFQYLIVSLYWSSCCDIGGLTWHSALIGCLCFISYNFNYSSNSNYNVTRTVSESELFQYHRITGCVLHVWRPAIYHSALKKQVSVHILLSAACVFSAQAFVEQWKNWKVTLTGCLLSTATSFSLFLIKWIKV